MGKGNKQYLVNAVFEDEQEEKFIVTAGNMNAALDKLIDTFLKRKSKEMNILSIELVSYNEVIN